MLPNPLHAAIVHFPVVLAVLLPLVAIGALIAIRRGARPLTAWGITSGVAAALLLASWVSLETGEAEEEKVEEVVSEGAIGRHEEAAQLFTMVAGGVLLLTVAGLAKGRIGTGMRTVATIGTLGVVAAGVNVGHSGGQLVYRFGAASAYAAGPGGAGDARDGQQGEGSARDEKGGDNDEDDR
ncbi:MAG: hypothetical protein U0163_16480 [Gemmatimonadaceae bacterium]